MDSISLGPYNWPSYLALSPDKRTLYVLVNVFDTTTSSFSSTYYEIDTRTKTPKYIGPNSSTAISPDGRYLFGAVGSRFTIFDAYTHQNTYQDSTVFYPICFDGQRHLVYGSTGKLGEVGIFDYKTKHWVRILNIHLWDGQVPAFDHYVLSLNGNELYLLARTYDYYFCVYDLARDSLLVQLGVNSSGQLAITPDGSTVYLTDPGGGGSCVAIEPNPTEKLGVFDTRTKTPLPSIDLSSLRDSLDPVPVAPFFIRITPDGKKAYLTVCSSRVLVIDLERNEPLKVIVVPKPHQGLDMMAL
ncbi:MAG TPA: hypothetical protein VMT04_10475 [Terriglobales bacterium]|nr:hypothetical protein [Terriglobales bacterium]